MGQDKALLELGGEPLVARALRHLRSVCAEVKILSGPECFERDAILSCYAHLVSDEDRSYAGPLAALAACLADCQTSYALLLAVDQPAVTQGLLQYLGRNAMQANSLAACFLRCGQPEPLPLIVSRQLRRGVERCLLAGERRLLPSVQACLAQLGQELLLIPVPETQGKQFTNLNTPDDLMRWRGETQSNHSAVRASERDDG